jgi:hypothetical protein
MSGSTWEISVSVYLPHRKVDIFCYFTCEFLGLKIRDLFGRGKLAIVMTKKNLNQLQSIKGQTIWGTLGQISFLASAKPTLVHVYPSKLTNLQKIIGSPHLLQPSSSTHLNPVSSWGLKVRSTETPSYLSPVTLLCSPMNSHHRNMGTTLLCSSTC